MHRFSLLAHERVGCALRRSPRRSRHARIARAGGPQTLECVVLLVGSLALGAGAVAHNEWPRSYRFYSNTPTSGYCPDGALRGESLASLRCASKRCARSRRQPRAGAAIDADDAEPRSVRSTIWLFRIAPSSLKRNDWPADDEAQPPRPAVSGHRSTGCPRGSAGSLDPWLGHDR